MFLIELMIPDFIGLWSGRAANQNLPPGRSCPVATGTPHRNTKNTKAPYPAGAADELEAFVFFGGSVGAAAPPPQAAAAEPWLARPCMIMRLISIRGSISSLLRIARLVCLSTKMASEMNEAGSGLGSG